MRKGSCEAASKREREAGVSVESSGEVGRMSQPDMSVSFASRSMSEQIEKFKRALAEGLHGVLVR